MHANKKLLTQAINEVFFHKEYYITTLNKIQLLIFENHETI